MTGPLSLRLPPELAERLVEQLPSLADEVVAAIAGEVPAYARPLEGGFGAGVRRGVQLALARFLSLAGEEPGVRRGPGGPWARGLHRAGPRRGPGRALAGRAARRLPDRRARRLGAARPDGPGRRAARRRELVQLAAAVFAYIDELSAASAEGFTAEQSALAGDRERRQRTLAQLLLTEVPAWQVEEAATVAGWPPPATLTAVLVPVRAGREVAARWDARTLLAAEDDRSGTALLLLPDVDGPGQRDRLFRLLAGRPSVVGLPRPWLEARLSVALVRRAVAGAEPTGVQRVEDRLAALVVTADPLALAELTARRLAPFADLTPRSRERLLDTLRVWLAHHGDRQAVAAELAIHPQTVRYRVGLLRDLLGDDLADPLRRFELTLVLHSRPSG